MARDEQPWAAREHNDTYRRSAETSSWALGCFFLPETAPCGQDCKKAPSQHNPSSVVMSWQNFYMVNPFWEVPLYFCSDLRKTDIPGKCSTHKWAVLTYLPASSPRWEGGHSYQKPKHNWPLPSCFIPPLDKRAGKKMAKRFSSCEKPKR